MAENMKVYIFVKIPSSKMESCPIKSWIIIAPKSGTRKEVLAQICGQISPNYMEIINFSGEIINP